jgi:cytochrome c-type biogenesis protein CcmE
LAVATTLVLIALQDTIVFFYSPTQVVEQQIELNRTIRLGGLVQEASVQKQEDAIVKFVVTDGVASVPVRFAGILPDLFREGQGIVVTGSLMPDGVLVADQVLAKHDENYMPREVAEALKEAGTWHGDDDTL